MTTRRISQQRLAGSTVTLEPLTSEHVDALAVAAASGRETFEWTSVPDGVDATTTYVDELVAGRERGEYAPFVQCDATTGTALGCTRFMNPYWWFGRDDPDEIEIGGTWLTASAQRTGINTEAKLLLLEDAFGRLGVQRVSICTDARNAASRAAIERIGARFEGILHRHRRSMVPGETALRNSAMYSVVRDEWPDIRRHITSLLERHRPDRGHEALR